MRFVQHLEQATAVALTRAAFRARFGTEPEVVARAPGRVNLMGEHTDYNRGLVLPIALPHSTWLAARRRADAQIVLFSEAVDAEWRGPVEAAAPGQAKGSSWVAYAVGVLWTLRRAGIQVPGMELLVRSEVPIGAGLASSAALECAVGAAALAVAGVPLDEQARELLVRCAIDAEQEVVGASTGGMDQTVSVFGEPGHALLIDFGADRRHAVPLDFEQAQASLLVTNTGVAHTNAGGGYAQRRAECDRAAQALGIEAVGQARLGEVDGIEDPLLRRRARHVISEISRVEEAVTALRASNNENLGQLMNASHLSLRDDFEVSCAEVDLAVARAGEAGALGARLTGGGFGGSSVALVPTERVEAIAATIDGAFTSAGFLPPQHLVAAPSAGAAIC